MELKQKYLLYRNNSIFINATSLAATWVWAPAIYLAYELTVRYGLFGFSLFAVPNFLSLMIFGFVAQNLREQMDGYTLGDIVKQRAGKGQYCIHVFISILLLIFSSVVQLFGIVVLLQQFFPETDRLILSLVTSLICFLYTFRHGLKSSILGDVFKYVILIVGVGYLLGESLETFPSVSQVLEQQPETDKVLLLTSYGITTILSLSLSQYADQTFWQRTFSMNPVKIRSTYLWAAILFIIVPLSFCLIATSVVAGGNLETNAAAIFTESPKNLIFAALVLAALMATLDSNLCAISSIVWNELKLDDSVGQSAGPISMALLLILANMIFYLNMPLLTIFLIYGTIRMVVGIPTILLVYKKCDTRRLFWITVLTLTVGCSIFIVLKTSGNGNAWMAAALVAFLPLLAWKKK